MNRTDRTHYTESWSLMGKYKIEVPLISRTFGSISGRFPS